MKIVEGSDSVTEAPPKVNKKSQKKNPPAPAAPLPQNRKGGVKRKAEAMESVKPTAAKKGRKR